MKALFVPTDFSNYAKGAMRMATLISEKAGSPIFLHTNIISQGISDVQEKKELAETKLKASIDSDFPKGVPIEKIITEGATHEEIVHTAKKLHAELIILGSHSDEEHERYFIGSNVQKVIRFAACPVLMVKKDFSTREIKKIVFSSQFDEDVHQPFAEVLKLAKIFNSSISLLFVNTPGNFKDARVIAKQLNEFAARYPGQKIEVSTYNHHDPVNGILEFCQDVKADVICTVTQDRRHSAKYLIGITESLAFHSEIPVLSINERIFAKQLH